MSFFRFLQIFRLIKPKQYQKVTREGGRIGHRKVIARYIENQQKNARLGFIIPKKAIPKAVQRNYIKRINREIFRNLQHELPEMDIVIIVTQEAKGSTNAILREEIEVLWKKISRLKAKNEH